MTPRLFPAAAACLLLGTAAPAALSQTAAPPPAAGPQVTVYRNNPEHTGYTAQTMPTPVSLVWQHTTEAAKNNPASPISANGVIYFGSGAHFYAVNAADGTLKWQFPADAPAPGNFASTPSLDGGALYIGADDGRVYKVDAKTGTQVWVRNFVGAIRSSPIVSDGLVYFGGTDRSCYALNTDSGQTVWSYATQGPITTSPTLLGNQVIFASTDNTLHGLNAKKGDQIWQIHLPSDPSSSPPLYADGNLYVGAGTAIYEIGPRGANAHAVRDFGIAVTAPPTFNAGMLYVVTQDRKVTALNTRGRVRWTATLDYLSSAAPLLAGGLLLVPTNHGILYGFDAATGALKWQYVVQAAGTKTQPKYQYTNIASAPIWVGGTLYVLSDDGTLSAFRANGTDKVAPQVMDMTPAPGAVVAGVRIPYGARVFDDGSGLDPTTVKFMVDDAPASLVKYDPSKNGVFLDLNKDLQGFADRPATDGLHQARLEAKDWRGNAVTKTWAFVVDNDLDPPGTPSAPTNASNQPPPNLAPSFTPNTPNAGLIPAFPTATANVPHDAFGGVNGGPPPPPPLDGPPVGTTPVGGGPTPPTPPGGGAPRPPTPPGGGTPAPPAPPGGGVPAPPTPPGGVPPPPI